MNDKIINTLIIVLMLLGFMLVAAGTWLVVQSSNNEKACTEKGGVYVSTYVHKCFKKDAIIPLN